MHSNQKRAKFPSLLMRSMWVVCNTVKIQVKLFLHYDEYGY